MRPSPRSLERLRALRLLARCPDGCTEAVMMAYGFSIGMLAELVFDKLAATKVEKTRAGGRTLNVVRLKITDAGRRALAG